MEVNNKRKHNNDNDQSNKKTKHTNLTIKPVPIQSMYYNKIVFYFHNLTRILSDC
jgi:hypothetical protein